jgi:DNA gyrase/topoisomerase IV subunit A
MDTKDILDTIKSDSVKELKKEFAELMNIARQDKTDFIKNSAEQVRQALEYRAKGLLTTDDVITLLKKQKKIAQIEANNAKIALLTKIHKLTYRLIDIAIDVLVKAIVPVA